MGRSGSRYRYGASFVDEVSGVRFEGHHPMERPDLWRRYLDDAEGKYRSRGFEGTLRRRDLEEGNGVALFFIGFATDGEAVAGVRFHGPLESSFDAAILEEMAASSEIEDIRALIENDLRLGVLEVKGAWSKGEAALGVRLVAAISRSVTHAMNWLGSERAVAAVSDSLVPVGSVAGGRQVGTTWVPFPDERYRTVAVTWQRSRSQELSTPEHQVLLRREHEQLARWNEESASPIESVSVRTRSFQPMVLDVSVRSQREVLRVLREDDALQIIDRYDEQRAQLAEVKPTPSAPVLNEGQRWVYYPWRRALVRLLAPRSFATLRLDRNRNKLTSAEQARQRTLRVGVIGVSAGHSIAHVLAMEGLVGELRLADFDTVELSNLNRIPASVLDLGLNKAVVASRRIAEIDPYLRVVTVPEGITPENLDSFLDGLDLVIEECDSLDVKFLVREAARARRIPVIMETSDRGVLDVERYDLEPRRAIFHGLLGEMDYQTLSGLSTAEKGPYVLKMLGPRDVSSRAAATFFELGSTITGWPQLASEVTLGAASVAAAVRRFGQGGDLPSGRLRLDVEEILEGLAPVEVEPDPLFELAAPAPTDPLPVNADDVELIVDAARRAPSGGNVQPWRFEADDEEVRFFLVPERTSMMDIAHRGSYVGLGAALFNARVAAATRSRLGSVKLFPDGEHSHHVATLRLGRGTDAQLAALYDAVPTRSANRRPGKPEEIDPALVALLAHHVQKEGASLRFVTDRERLAAIGELLGRTDRLRFLLPEVHQQMLHEVRWPGRDSLEEGLDVRALEMDPMSLAALDLLRRPDVMGHLAEWRAGQMLGLRTQAVVSSSSAVAAITVPRADPTWYVRAGAALERFWLHAEVAGLAVQPVAPVFLYATNEVDLVGLGGERYLDEMFGLHQRFSALWDLTEGETLTMVLRVFSAPPPTVHSVRLPLGDVLSRETKPVLISQNGHNAGG